MAVIIENGRELFPVVAQDGKTLDVLMVAFADAEALNLTRSTGVAHFFSRSRERLWKKGETSGHILRVTAVVPDCDNDSFLYVCVREHPVCHRGTPSCFDDAPRPERADPVGTLRQYIADRLGDADTSRSYTAALAYGPLEKLLKKIGEEAIEVIVAAVETGADQHGNLIWESTDLLYHLSVLWHRFGIEPGDLLREIIRRHP